MTPYKFGGDKESNKDHRVLIDVQQIIPLPGAEQCQIRVRDKHLAEQVRRRGRGGRVDLDTYLGIIGSCNARLQRRLQQDFPVGGSWRYTYGRAGGMALRFRSEEQNVEVFRVTPQDHGQETITITDARFTYVLQARHLVAPEENSLEFPDGEACETFVTSFVAALEALAQELA